MKLGDKAIYFPNGNDPLASIDTNGLLALCVYVHLSGLVNLSVFSPFGRVEGRTNVEVAVPDDANVAGKCKSMVDTPSVPNALPFAATIELGQSEAAASDFLKSTETASVAPETNPVATPEQVAAADAIPPAPPVSNDFVVPGAEQFEHTVDGTGTAEQQPSESQAETAPVLSDVVLQSPGIPIEAPVQVDGVDTSSNPIQ